MLSLSSTIIRRDWLVPLLFSVLPLVFQGGQPVPLTAPAQVGDSTDRETPKQETSLDRETHPSALTEQASEKTKTPQPTPQPTARQRRIEQCLTRHYAHPVRADRLRPWSIMHGVLAFGRDSVVSTQGYYVDAVDYLCENGRGDDRHMLSVENGKLNVRSGRGLQGHEGQLLAILAQARVPIDHPIVVAEKKFTIQDMVAREQATCRKNTELTFKLIGLSCYLGPDVVWKNDQGESWDVSRLIHEEISQPINSAACGGVHRLMALSYALEIRRARNETVNGQWKRIENYIDNYHRYAFSLQNPDGTFSTDWFAGMSHHGDTERKLYTTGHVLEWLAFSLPQERLESPEMANAVDAMLTLLETRESRKQELGGFDVGPVGHALRALRLYELRMYGEPSNHRQLATLDPDRMRTPAQIAALQPATPSPRPTANIANIARPNPVPTRQASTPTHPPRTRQGRLFRRR